MTTTKSVNCGQTLVTLERYIFLVKYVYACFTMTPQVTANIIRRKSLHLCDYLILEHEGGARANELVWMFDNNI